MSKYEYCSPEKSQSNVPSAQLKERCNGVIERVDFYPNDDYLRGDGVNIGLDLDYVQQHLGYFQKKGSKILQKFKKKGPKTLEEFTDEQLKLLSSKPLGDNKQLPLDELKELRELERMLRKTIGDYRD